MSRELVVVDRNGAGQRAYDRAGVEIACAVEHSRAGGPGESPGATRHDVGPDAMVDSHGTLMIGEHARIRGEIRTKSVKVRGQVEGNIFVTERCELQAGSTVRGDIEAPRLMVDENATFCGSAKVGTGKSLPA